MIGGAYLVRELIGIGGMGRVYRAEQKTLGRTVAVKVIHPHLLGDEQTVARFYTEARASSRLNHPNSVSVIDFGRTEDGTLYLVMEYLEGKDLAMVITDEGPLPMARIVTILSSVLDALSEAHALDVVHRDLKPENVILKRLRDGRELVKVVDFGLATITNANNETSITRPGLVCGTPDYMAPEQGKGEGVDGRSDVYACGVLLFELLTDLLPFDADTPTKVVLRHINDPVPDPRTTAPHRSIPDSLAEVTMKALAKNPRDRYQSAQEMAEAIRSGFQSAPKTEAAPTRECPACGARFPVSMQFCGSCGSRYQTKLPPAPANTRHSSFLPPVSTERPFVGRKAELETILDAAKSGLSWVHVHGEIGVGRTRLLKEASDTLASSGAIVVGASALPYAAPVAYGPIAALLEQLANEPIEQLRRHALDPELDPLVRAGFDELANPQGVRGIPAQPRHGGVAAALSHVAEQTAKKARVSQVVLIVDDLDRCDQLSADTLSYLAQHASQKLFILSSGEPPVDGASKLLALSGLDLREVVQFVSKGKPADDRGRRISDSLNSSRKLLPLYLDQLDLLDAELGRESRPGRLVDVVAQRVDRLGARARRLLQVVGAFGGRATLKQIREIADETDFSGLDELSASKMVTVDHKSVEVTHPLIADLVEAFIPASARAELHSRILTVIEADNPADEILAEHSYRGANPMSALMVLERVGDAAMRRGDARASVRAHQRALELARRESLETGDSMMDSARATFSWKLGWALAVSGEVASGEGTIREAIELLGPSDPTRGRMNLVLGRVYLQRGRTRDAMRAFGAALELVAGVQPRLESELQMALGKLRATNHEYATAANAFRRALELFEEERGDRAQLFRARAHLRLAEVQFALGATKDAKQHARKAIDLGSSSGGHAICADGHGLVGRISELLGATGFADESYLEAADSARLSGDIERVEKWESALKHIRQG